MSRVGKHPVAIPKGVEVKLAGQTLAVKGKLGELSLPLRPEVKVAVADGQVSVEPNGGGKFARAMWGTTRANVACMVKGVSDGFVRKLNIEGIGYKVAMQGAALKMSLGYSHDVIFDAPKGVKLAAPTPTAIEVSGIDKQAVGQAAARIRQWRPTEPYKGKGIRFEGEFVRRKQGKKK
ncbi:50S ribosomal protein L6 [Alphaproteobacteria bacterium]|nr:50S ribosomal protein L6 [Alphaproteobacteria bacterium]